MTPPPAVGGVMPAARGGRPRPDSILAAWSSGWAHRACFSNARSALAAFLRARAMRRAWLPAYACPALADAVIAGGAEARFYAVSLTLEADISAVERGARVGDAVIGVDFFGRSADAAFADLRHRRPDLVWIEDRAQALETGAPPWGEAVIYSPRKLVGVADGGLLFSRSAVPAPPAPPLDLWSPEDARADDPDGRAPESWYGLFKTREAGMAVGSSAMSPRGLAALDSLAAAPIVRVRRRNWRRLAQRLGAFALWPDLEPAFAPLAFPIVVADAAAAVVALAAERIWAPRHWPDLTSPADAFPEAHALSRRLVSLPCDQRYGAADMDRVARAVLRLLQPR